MGTSQHRRVRKSVVGGQRSTAAVVHMAKFDGVDVQAELQVCIMSRVGELMGNRASRVARLQREADLVGTVRAQYLALANGRLPVDGDDKQLRPVASQPDMWEVTFPHRDLRLLRSYHGEPRDGCPPEVVVVHVHLKKIDGMTSSDVMADQNQHMKRAQDCYESGRYCRWGYRPE